MTRLSELIDQIEIVRFEGSKETDIVGLAFDSRNVEPGYLFFAIRGIHTDGYQFIGKAIEKGAVAIVCESFPENLPDQIAWIKVNDCSSALGKIASAFYGNPSSHLKLVGVTGTNGKTTTATLLHRLTKELGYKAGLISTIVYEINDTQLPATHTTPDPLQLNSLMKKMVDEGCSYCFMEVSSHAVDQKRIEGLSFDGAIFTNITHDHLDYHKTFDAYIKAKKQFFDKLDNHAFALSNCDDKNGYIMLQNTKACKRFYSTRTMADFMGKILESHFDGTLLQINGKEVWAQFVGKFNAYNLLAVYGAACLLNFDPEEVLLALSKMVPVDGRFELFRSVGGVYAIVDYAHTPDALKNVLETIGAIRTKNEQLICLIGAGGDRDKTKRPEMAAIACQYSDKVILTSDNPRTEDPLQILRDMEAGVDVVGKRKLVTLPDRREAIKTAVLMAAPGDIILIAGKGHENYQEIMGVKYPFDDREEIKKLFDM